MNQPAAQQQWQQQRPIVRHAMPQQNAQMNMMQQQTFQPPPVYPADAPRNRMNFQQQPQQQVYQGQVMHQMSQQQLLMQAKQHMASGGKPMQPHLLQNQHTVMSQSPLDQVRSPNPSTVRSPQPIPSPRPQGPNNPTPSPRPLMAGTHQLVQNSSHAPMSGVQHAGMNSDHGNMEVMLPQPQNTQSDSRSQVDLLKFVDKL